MNAPDHDDPFAYDDRLRAHYEEAGQTPPVPPAHLWERLQTQLHPAAPPRAPRRAPLLAGFGGLLLGVVLTVLLNGWWGGVPAAHPTAATRPVAGAVPASQRPSLNGQVVENQKLLNGSAAPRYEMTNRPTRPQPAAGWPTADYPAQPKATSATARHMAADGVPEVAPGGPPAKAPGLAGVADSAVRAGETAAVPAVLLPLVQTETALAELLPLDTVRTTRQRRRAVLLAQRAELGRLRLRTDSLLRWCGEELVAAPADSVPAVAPLRQRWSVALAFAPERNFFGLSSPETDTLSALRRTHEQGRGGYNAAVLAEYRVDQRLSVAAGLGLASYGAELRLTDHRTSFTTRLDSTTTSRTQENTVLTTAYAIRTVVDSILSPILNFQNQIIGYESLPITRQDTVRTNISNTEITTLTTTVYTPTITQRDEVSARILKPNYRFLTVPVLLRYRLGRAPDWAGHAAAPRWWADVAVGAQLQFFLGGTQVTTRDGRLYQTERVKAGNGPFRPFNVALTGAVALNYALTPHLSASLAPTLRYQAESVYKASTNLSQRPTATGLQVGLKYAF